MRKKPDNKRAQFDQNGFCIFENVIDDDLLRRLRILCNEILAQQDPKHFEQQVSTGSMIMIDWDMANDYPEFAELIAHPNTLTVLRDLGFPDPKFGHGRVISKPPHSPPLFWHEDGRFWDDPVSYTDQPIQCFLMYYLTDTTPDNGCLRVIPGSHRKRHPLHNKIAPRHTEKLATYANPSDPGFSHVDDELSVPVKAGDLVMGSGNLLHASHPNKSDEHRTVLTMWYYPAFTDLPERTQATVALAESKNMKHVQFSDYTMSLMEPLRIRYGGKAHPIEIQWIPGKNLK